MGWFSHLTLLKTGSPCILHIIFYLYNIALIGFFVDVIQTSETNNSEEERYIFTVLVKLKLSMVIMSIALGLI